MSNLEKREASIAQQEAQLKIDRDQLTHDQGILTQDMMILESRKQLQAETETYWKNYKNDSARSRIVAFAGGVAVGFVLGGYSGFRLGVTIQY